ncbi:MAG: SagB/ThcOx family dehydrogenase [Deltaproteobacteria bacterium]|nr:SagB/ThcOx family dehydrogenase [Deltaproteobacteria bacterium]
MGIRGSEYQDQTAYDRYGMSGGGLDWGNQPSVFREYPHLPVYPLSEPPAWPEGNVWQVMCGPEITPKEAEFLPENLAAILYLSGGVTARAKHGHDWFYYRAPASAGALYPFEVYCATCGVRSLEDGLYHFTVSRSGLSLLRQGNFTESLDRLVDASEPSGKPSVIFVLSAIFFRSAWKYRERAYRYCLYDTGHLLENLLLSLKFLSIPFDLHLDFGNAEVERLSGIDDEQEGALALVRAYWRSGGPVSVSAEQAASPVSFQAGPLCPGIRTFDKIVGVHRETGSVDSVASGGEEPGKKGPWLWEAVPEAEGTMDFPSFVETVQTRRSKRNYVVRPVSKGRLGTLLGLILGPSDSDLYRGPRPDLGILVGDVADTAPGFYRIDPRTRQMALVKEGDLLRDMADAALNQMWLARAAVLLVMFADLKKIEDRYGPRSYRHLMLKAGMLGQRVYLAATGLGMGACGIGAFYDAEAANVLGLEPAERVLYLVAAGPVKR